VQRQYNENDVENGFRIRLLRAEIALAEHRWDDARRDLSPDRPARCNGCLQFAQAAAYDGGGRPDSAMIWYEKIGNSIGRTGIYVPLTFRRLGELYASKGDTPSAIKWYQRFVDSWKEAEPRLQPQVADVRQRLVRLKEQEGKGR
jgi:tetratricopeptide (TPR) repeat protein